MSDATIQAAAVQCERVRIRAILYCEEAKGREKMAQHLAFETLQDALAARAILAAAAKAGGMNGGFFEAMAQIENPRIGVGYGDGVDGTGIQSSKEIFAARARASGHSIEAGGATGEGA